MKSLFEFDIDDLSSRDVLADPFPHTFFSNVFPDNLAHSILHWLESFDQWRFTQTDFYTQYEFDLSEIHLPQQLSFLNSKRTRGNLANFFSALFKRQLQVSEITVHKLIDGFKMGVHNDFIGSAETHRLVIQINEKWGESNGGYLMLFKSESASDVAKVIRPVSNTAIGFEISKRSFHAVSTVNNFSRFTIGYTFNERE